MIFFDQFLQQRTTLKKGWRQDARPLVLGTELVTGLQSIDEWRDQRARFKLAMNDLNNVLCTDDFMYDQDALRVARGLLEDIEELRSNLRAGARPRTIRPFISIAS